MLNETIQKEEGIETTRNSFPRPAFVVLPKEEEISINEMNSEQISSTKEEEANPSDVAVEEEPKEEEIPVSEIKPEQP
ncbi:MAG: hypothetical protein HFG40_00195, partial [Bacilli bacterium]|nr:hypothetical protein [Bacilli bacterium]